MRAWGQTIRNYWGSISISNVAAGTHPLSLTSVDSSQGGATINASVPTGGYVINATDGINTGGYLGFGTSHNFQVGTVGGAYGVDLYTGPQAVAASLVNGLFMKGATGGDTGVGSINAASLYINGSPLYTGAPVVTFASSNPAITLAGANKTYVSTASGLTITIPANASVAFPLGTMLTFANYGGGTMSIAITTDTLTLANTTSSGTRSLANNGVATAIKVQAGYWYISGTGLT